MSKCYVPSSAPGVRPLLYIYDRSRALLFDPWTFVGATAGLQYSSMLPGGYESCSFSIPWSIAKEMMTKAAYRIAVRCGFQTAWEGRIADVVRKTGGGGVISVQALGGWEHLKQRRVTMTAQSGDTAKDLIERMLADFPLISSAYGDIGDPNFAITDMSWTRKDAQTVIQDVAKLGDDQTPPRTWYFSVWGTDELSITGSYSGSITASARDAYCTNNDSDDSYTSTVVRLGGQGTTRFYTGGFIYPALGIPRYTVIKTATQTMVGAGETGTDDPCRLKIYCELSGAPDAFSTSWPDERVKTTEYEAWTPNYPGLGGWPADNGVNVTTDDFTAVVQEAVNYSAWTTDSGLCVIVQGQYEGGLDTRKQCYSYDNAASTAATIAITYGTTDETTMAFHPEFQPRQGTSASDIDYLIYADDVEGGFDLVPSLETTVNYVVAKYGGSSYTASAEDTDSQSLWDRRENNPEDLNASESAGSAQAVNLRDAYLEEHKDPKWKANDITVKRLFNRWGWPVNPAAVRAGCIIKLVDFPTFDVSEERAYFVARTRYDADSGALTLSPELQQDTLEIQLLRVKQESKAD